MQKRRYNYLNFGMYIYPCRHIALLLTLRFKHLNNGADTNKELSGAELVQ